MEPAQIVKINGNEYTLIMADGKEHSLILPSELADMTRPLLAEAPGKAPAASDQATASFVPHSYNQSTAQSVTPVSTAGTTVWNQDLSHWTPKLGTDLDSKWLQRIETDYMTSQLSYNADSIQQKQTGSPEKVQDAGSSYIPVSGRIAIPVLSKADLQQSKSESSVAAFRLAATTNPAQTLITVKPTAKQIISSNKNIIQLPKGHMGMKVNTCMNEEHMGMKVNMNEGNMGMKVNMNEGNMGDKVDINEGNMEMIHSAVSEKNMDQNNALENLTSVETVKTSEQSKPQLGYSIIYRSKLEKAIEQNNLNSANSQNTSVTTSARSNQATLKRLLNSTDYSSPMILQNQNASHDSSKHEAKKYVLSRDESDNVIREDKSQGNGHLFLSSDTNMKRSLNRKVESQAHSTAAAEFYKKFVHSEHAQPKNISCNSEATLFVSPGIEKCILDKEAETVRQTWNMAGQAPTAGMSLLTSLAQSNSAPVTVSSAGTGRFTFSKGREKRGWQEEKIIEKEYVDNSLAKDILERMWGLREQEMFCDAVIFTGETQVKLHKLVLAGASAEMNKRVMTSKDAELMLLLPDGIAYDSILLFISYLYHGRLKLTVDNVQALYRLSGLFHIEQLKKHCYDFCRLAKMGHLIISSPYQEAAKQVAEAPKSIGQQKNSKPPSKDKPATHLAKSPVTESDITAGSDIKPVSAAKPLTRKEVKSADFDWMNLDPSQSNIPIRKRGRTRKGLTNPSNISVTEASHEMAVETSMMMEKDIIESERKGKNDAEVKQNSESVTESHKGKPRDIPKKKKNIDLLVSPKVKDSDLDDVVVKQLNDLPDPLATGKFDESELLKIVPTQEELAPTREEITAKTKHGLNKPQSGKTMVTRFRNRPKTMSVMEAASQKKAKSNDTSSVFTPKTPIKNKGKGKKQGNGINGIKSPKRNEKLKFENATEIDKEEPVIHSYAVKEKYNTDVGKGKNQTSYSSFSPEMENNNSLSKKVKTLKHVLFKSSSETSHQAELGSETDKENIMEKQKVTESSDKVAANEENLKRKRPVDVVTSVEMKSLEVGENMSETSTEQHEHLASPPKKARQRKLTLESQECPKDTVYMRPPPKKRTKEIREMMKNENAVLEVEKNIAALEQFNPFPENSLKIVGNEPEKAVTSIEDKKLSVRKGKKTVVKDDSLMQQVYRIEMSGKSVEGEKQYRCTLCNNVFIFARRVVSHLVNTHDTVIEDASENVTVEPRNYSPKVCDICGYQTKEVNIYYIHYHKYFRHGVPLPKGWQPFTCDLCKKEFFTKFQLREHKLIHFEDNPFVCEHCGSGFKSRTCLNSHVFHKHSSVRRHTCGECPKTFKTRTQLKVHKRTHSGDKPFACTDAQCNYRSTTRGNMRLHLVNRHKFANDHIKDIMNALQPSVAPIPEQGNDGQETNWIDSSQESERDINEDRALEMASDPATLTTLVEAAVAEVNGSVGYTVPNLNETNGAQSHGVTPVLSNVENMASQLMNQDHMMNAASREIEMSLVHPVQMVQNISVVNPQGHDENSAGHVPMIVQPLVDIQHSSSMLVQQQDQNSGALQSYHQNSEEHALTAIPLHEYRDRDLPMVSQAYSIPQEPRMEASLQILPKARLDPHSREARMLVKEALQGHESRSLLKAAILKDNIDTARLLRGTNDGTKFSLETRQELDHHLQQSDTQFLDEDVLVIDTTQTLQEPQLVIDEDQEVHSLRVHEQFRGGHPSAVFRGGNDASLPNTHHHHHHHHQDLDQGHLQQFQQTSLAPPPSYSGQSQGLIATIPVTDISASHSGLTLTSVSQGQFQSEAGQSAPVQQSPGYSSNTTQPQTAQINSDGSIYVGYYQQQFPIENY